VTDEVEFYSDCGWNHASISRCWRKTKREALEKLADPDLDQDIRVRLQSAVDRFELHRLDTIEFFREANRD
jgi:hypothetical protein